MLPLSVVLRKPTELYNILTEVISSQCSFCQLMVVGRNDSFGCYLGLYPDVDAREEKHTMKVTLLWHFMHHAINVSSSEGTGSPGLHDYAHQGGVTPVQNPGFLTKFFSVYPQWNPGTKYLRVLILGLLGHAAFYEDETRCEVCPYADLRGNLSFTVRVKVK